MASPPPDLFFKIMTRTHSSLYRLSRGKLGAKMAGMSVLLLMTTGRKSGQKRTATLSYLRDGDDYLITGSKGGAESHPAWYFNLEADPAVEVQVGADVFPAKATIAEGEERNRLYDQFKALSDEYVQYAERTERVIPVVRLTRI